MKWGTALGGPEMHLRDGLHPACMHTCMTPNILAARGTTAAGGPALPAGGSASPQSVHAPNCPTARVAAIDVTAQLPDVASHSSNAFEAFSCIAFLTRDGASRAKVRSGIVSGDRQAVGVWAQH